MRLAKRFCCWARAELVDCFGCKWIQVRWRVADADADAAAAADHAAAVGQGCFTPNPLPPFSAAARRCRSCPRCRGCIPICSMQSSPEPDLAWNRLTPPPRRSSPQASIGPLKKTIYPQFGPQINATSLGNDPLFNSVFGGPGFESREVFFVCDSTWNRRNLRRGS